MADCRTGPEAAEEEIPGLRHTVWDQQDQKVQYPKLQKDVSADVVVVGAGIAGLSVAYNLVKEGKKVIVLEARVIGAGQTGRTTAHIMPWFDDFYHIVEKVHGTRKTQLVADSYKKAVDWIDQTVEEENIECNFSRVDGYLFPHDDSKQAYDSLQNEFDACQRLKFNVQMVDLHNDPSCGSISTALHFPDAAEFHPLMYLNGLARAMEKRGAQLYELTRAMNVQGNQVITADGIVVTAGAVVMATNSPLNHNLAIHAQQTPDHSYVVGLKLPKGSVRRAQWWDTASPYHYVRIEQKDTHDILIVGGEDTSTGMKQNEYPDAYAKLEAWARARWPSAGEALYKWTGQVFEPVDMLHIIGHDPLKPGEHDQYIVTGDSGQGMTGSTIGGILIKDMILGVENPWAEVYAPSRCLPLSKSTMYSLISQTAHTVQGYKDILPFAGVDHVDIEDMAPCSGCVVQQGIHKVAIYKDIMGGLHKYSAVCPHMGCIVKWNPIDHTFDCPCHGSKFDHYGHCINAPAKADLSPQK
ncbi:unnamed protein product [Sphagnum troendelagicum]|uniref:Rieske domain-containing protein n=1 Tax=Sphagnum jensenii TaxID=128206 RepID=A0ABP0WNF3_9BRYO